MRWILAIIIIGLLVFIHELGHFLIAKINGVDVEEFSLGFGPRLVSRQIGDTLYSIKALPFGGACMMKGMYEAVEESLELDSDESDEDEGVSGGQSYDASDDKSSVSDDKSYVSDDKVYVAAEGSFPAASLGRRAAIVLAGPIFNFILAFVAAVVIISCVGYDPALVMRVEEGSAAEAAGLKEGDTISRLNGKKIVIGRDVSAYMNYRELPEGEPLDMTVVRDGETLNISYLPDDVAVYRMGITYNLVEGPLTVDSVSEGSPLDEAGLKPGDVISVINDVPLENAAAMTTYLKEHPLDGSKVALTYIRDGQMATISVNPVEIKYRDIGFDYNLGRAPTNALGILHYSAYEVKFWITMTVDSLKMFFTGEASINDLSGPVGIADIVGETYEESRSEGTLITFLNMLNLVILLSANLGVMNLLPIPGLDGGRLLFIIIEAVIGRPVNRRLESTIQLVAAALLMALMFYVMFHDITLLFH